jgi:parallel beta-helix repeat protein
MSKAALITVFSLLAMVQVPLAATYYVAPWGNNSNPGTFDRPWLTIGWAAGRLVARDTVLIRGGTYKESVSPANSGIPGGPIVYAAYDTETVVVDGTEEITNWTYDGTGNRYRATVAFTPSPRFMSSRDPSGNLGGLVLQNGAKMRYRMSPSAGAVDSAGEYYMNDSLSPPYTLYAVVRDLGSGYNPNNYQMEIGRQRKLFDLDGGEDYLRVEGLKLRGANDNAIHSIDSDSCAFDRLSLYSSFITGIYLTSGSDKNIIRRCEFWDNGHGGIELASSHKNLVSGNTFLRRDLGDGFGGNGCHFYIGPLSTLCDSTVIENNVAFAAGSNYSNLGFVVVNGSYTLIRDNSLTDFGLGRSGGMGGITLVDGRRSTVVNNAVRIVWGFSTIAVFPAAVQDSGHFIRYNDFYADDTTNRYWWNGVQYSSLAAWEAASGQGNNFNSNPMFVNPALDLSLQAGSPCINAGLDSLAPAFDFKGTPRPQGVRSDIGAYEYVFSGIESEGKTDAGDWMQEAGMTANPNPFVSFTRVVGHKRGPFALYDISGRRVGVYKGDMVGADMPPGVYFLRPVGQNSRPLRVVKVR